MQLRAGLLVVFAASGVEGQAAYGVDVSFPTQHSKVTSKHEPLGPGRQAFHDEYMKGCRQHYGIAKEGSAEDLCAGNELVRIQMALRQPQGMRNYTKTGFTKIRAPEQLMSTVRNFYNAHERRASPEYHSIGDTHTNHWVAPTSLVSVEDVTLPGAGHALKQDIWSATRNSLQDWTGQQVVECSLYGVRQYTRGAVLAPHVDRLPLVLTAVINVDQDVDEPWPLELIGHDGKAHNVTLEPGDMVLYEGHSILHGRPFPLQGRFVANVYIHFEPVGKLGGPTKGDAEVPAYIVPGSSEEKLWRASFRQGHVVRSGQIFEAGASDAHHMVHSGNLDQLKAVLNQSPYLANEPDDNGWTPLHEAVRFGNLELVRYLLERGADPNRQIGVNRDGGSALYLANHYHRFNNRLLNELTRLLQGYGGVLTVARLDEL